MADFQAGIQNLAGSAAEIVIALQLVVFLCVAVMMMHPARPRPGQGHSRASSGPQPSSSKASPPTRRSSEVLGPALALLHDQEGKGPAELASELFEMLNACEPETVTIVLTALLESAGREASAELLAAVREMLAARCLRPSVRVGELLLQGYLGLRLRSDFDDVLAEIKSSEGALPSITALTLQNLW
mmetsp:Transcript_10271/g.21758  ORF Transcript_10271/g.21758 Transcript_10271/m.21758 type:complete len:187 (-) Transcript_10271:263-823(-)